MNELMLICLVGLPRSGKSTWAKQSGHPIVCPDAIRLALHGQRFLPDAEPWVWLIAKTMVKALFDAGHDTVVLDATNVTRKRRDEWSSLKYCKTRFGVFKTSKEVCIQRAEHQEDKEIIPVIERMAAEFEPLGEGELYYTGIKG